MKIMAVLDGSNVITNVATWDGANQWGGSSNSGEITGRRLGKGQTYIPLSQDNSAFNVVIDGNSIPAHVGQRSTERGLLDAGLSPDSFVTVAINGKTTTQLMSDASTRVDSRFSALHGEKNICIFWEIINEVKLPTNAQQAFDNIKNYCLARKAVGWKTIVATCLPWTLAINGLNEERLAVNELIRQAYFNNEDWIDALADVALEEVMGDMATCSNSLYYSADGTHPTDLGHSLIKNYFRDAINQFKT